MDRSRAGALIAAGCVGLLASFSVCSIAVARPVERWPAWPTEISQIAAPLHRAKPGGENERHRIEALEALEAFATAAIEAELVAALSDPSPVVQTAALRQCALRSVARCIPDAVALWNRTQEGSLAMAALRAMAVAPDAATLALILGALRHPSEEMRAHAADLLGSTPLPPSLSVEVARREIEDGLLAKLSDPDSQVRAVVLRSLGRRGPGRRTLALTRLLDDPEPIVREATAVALAQRGDPHAVPALRRALEAPNEPAVRAAILDALARLPDESVVDILLAHLDAPPDGLTPYRVADAIGDRPRPEPRLLEGLLERLPDARLALPALRALLLLGRAAAPAMRQALDRGVEPSMHDALERLWRATQPLPPSRAPARPPALDLGHLRTLEPVAQWRAIVELDREPSAAWIAAVRRPWLEPRELETVRPWLAALASGRWGARLTRTAPERWATLLGWGGDSARSLSDRCLALAAVASAPPAMHPLVHDELEVLAGDARPEIRACVGQTAAVLRFDPLAAALLLDDAPEVRAATLRGLPSAPVSPSFTSILSVMAEADPDGAVRSTARRVLGATVAHQGLELRVYPATSSWTQGSVVWWPDEGTDDGWWVAPLSTGDLQWALVPSNL